MPAKVLSAANVVLYINGVLAGRVNAFSFSSSDNHTPIYALDQSEAYELAPTTSSCNCNISLYRTMGDGGAEGLGVGTRYPDVIRQKYVTLLLLERVTGMTLFQASRAKLTHQSWEVAAKQIISGQLSLMCLEWSNEVAPAALDGPPSIV